MSGATCGFACSQRGIHLNLEPYVRLYAVLAGIGAQPVAQVSCTLTQLPSMQELEYERPD